MTDDKINETIHEARGLCWHETRKGVWPYTCKTCNYHQHFDPVHTCNPDYVNSWAAFGAAWEWAQGQEWWSNFIEETFWDAYSKGGLEYFRAVTHIIDPRRFATALAEYLKEEK